MDTTGQVIILARHHQSLRRHARLLVRQAHKAATEVGLMAGAFRAFEAAIDEQCRRMRALRRRNQRALKALETASVAEMEEVAEELRQHIASGT